MSKRARPLILTLALCLLFILITSLMFRLSSNSLVKMPAPAQPVEMSETLSKMGMSPEVASLMQSLQRNPNDPVTLLSMVEVYLQQSDFSGAQNFVNRALMAAPADPEPQYYQGIIQAQLGQNTEAAESLERALKLGDTASTRFSLGILYIYSLGEKEKGITHLKAALFLPDITQEMRGLIEEELKKAGEKIPEAPPAVTPAPATGSTTGPATSGTHSDPSTPGTPTNSAPTTENTAQ